VNQQEKAGPYVFFILALSVLALVALGIEAAIPLDAASRQILGYADFIICGLFFIDFLLCLRRAEDKKRYLVTWGWLDLLSSIPTVGFLRFARAARIVRLLRVLRVARSARLLSSAILEKRAQSGLLAAALASVLLIVSTSIAILQVEKSPEANIRTAEDAIWWSVTTMTTVGYGDRYPTSSEGRLVAGFLMVGGVGLFGVVSGFLAAWFLNPTGQKETSEHAAIQQELAEMRRQLASLGARPADTPSPGKPE
jgi:voltage-gated potassium channel